MYVHLSRKRCLFILHSFVCTNIHVDNIPQGLYSLSRFTCYRKMSWSLEVAMIGLRLFQSLWNLTGTAAAALPRFLSTFRETIKQPIARLGDFTRFGGKTPYCVVNTGPVQRVFLQFKLFKKTRTWPVCCWQGPVISEWREWMYFRQCLLMYYKRDHFL